MINDLKTTAGALPFFETDGSGAYSYVLSEDDIVYGLDEQIRGINKRGWQYVSWNYDNPNHHEDTRSLYGAHNFIIVSGEQTFGAFFDSPGRMEFDIGYTSRSMMRIKPEKNDIAVYIITGTDEKDIVKQFRQLICRSYIPPFWAFGYGQSRWGYRREQDIRAVAEQYRAAGIPLDSIYLDIDRMERYKDFTIDPGRFPDMKKLVDDMKSQGIRLVPIIDAGVKIEEDYDVYEEGVQNNFFCKNADGGDFVGAVWPGRVHFPDFLQPEARKWFGDKYSVLTRLGIEGFWNDMNEPAIFYTEDRLADTCAEITNHSADWTRMQELFRFDNVAAGEMIKIRYCLIPYLYSEFLKAALNDGMMFRPLAFDFPTDDMAWQVDDQLLGGELMIAPVYRQNALGRYVYLPEEMTLVRMKSWDSVSTEVLPLGHHYVSVALDELVFFIRRGKAIPFGKPAGNTSEIDMRSLRLLGFPGGSYELYSDNGCSPDPQDSITVTVMSDNS